MSEPPLYLSQSSSQQDKVAKLNEQTFKQRLQDLTEALKSLDELAKLMKLQNNKQK